MELPLPMCAKCKRRVMAMIEQPAEATDELVFHVTCHGAIERYIVDLRTWAANKKAAITHPAFAQRARR